MGIEFDADKDAANQKKHGTSLADAERMEFDRARFARDDRHGYGEDRFQADGLIDGRVHVLIFTVRGDVLRAISLRKANPREVKRYDEEA